MCRDRSPTTWPAAPAPAAAAAAAGSTTTASLLLLLLLLPSWRHAIRSRVPVLMSLRDFVLPRTAVAAAVAALGAARQSFRLLSRKLVSAES
jgi:hypothetical protein